MSCLPLSFVHLEEQGTGNLQLVLELFEQVTVAGFCWALPGGGPPSRLDRPCEDAALTSVVFDL
jgi:hypothetical protein